MPPRRTSVSPSHGLVSWVLYTEAHKEDGSLHGLVCGWKEGPGAKRYAGQEGKEDQRRARRRRRVYPFNQAMFVSLQCPLPWAGHSIVPPSLPRKNSERA